MELALLPSTGNGTSSLTNTRLLPAAPPTGTMGMPWRSTLLQQQQQQQQ
jgi:hypothetical protein